MLPILHLGPFTFYTFGLCFGAAVCLGTALFLRFFRTHGIPVNPPVLAVILITAGFVGAKLDNALVIAHHVLHRQPFAYGLSLSSFTSGYTYLGCILGGSLAGAAYIHLNRLPWLRTFDSLYNIAPAYAVGRLGCFLAGDGDYGRPASLPWAVAFPHGLVPTAARVHPTMLYSAATELLLFSLLLALDRRWHRRLRPGNLLALYLLGTATIRFLVEFLSRNPPLAFGLTEAQLISLAFAPSALVLLLKRPHLTDPARKQLFLVPQLARRSGPVHPQPTRAQDF